ncbi:hypothetical protein FIV34_17650 [Luteibacter pinisoli]|uniref:Uncharacterized protein n=1 Tax=Luteibacter pinisoli TaxID=2589080 RepID=A0A4Y5Z975_9GAMM|nr:hypothetical protein [Luteibacter pinisoli]QDE40905.1 hypothetical protein FIV34_17650 [Luteibacter pinisoli]
MAVGFIGGSYMYDLGDRERMLTLSRLVKEVASTHPHGDDLHEKIFRTFVPLSDLPEARTLMQHVRETLRGARFTGDGPSYGRPYDEAVFGPYFDAFEECALSCADFFEDWGKLKPVRVARVDMPAYLADTGRSLEEIAALSGFDEPFWAKVSD